MPHSESNIDLAKALAAQDWWEWKEGMLWVVDGYEIQKDDPTIPDTVKMRAVWVASDHNDKYGVRPVPSYAFPDLTDWATIGILIGWICDLQPHYELHAHGAVDCGEAVARQLLTLMNWEGGEQGI